MSVEIGIPSRSIRYLNIHKEGKSNSEQCSVDARWSMPLLEKQDNYLVAITRFEVPMNRVPITQQLTNCISIYKYSETHPATFSDDEKNDYPAIGQHDIESAALGGMSGEKMTEWLNFWESKVPPVEMVSVEPCHTVYSFINTLNSNIKQKLLNVGRAPPTIYPRGGPVTNNFLFNDNTTANTTEPNAYFGINMNADFTFRVEMNHKFAESYCIKMSQPLFNMLGFKEGPVANGFNFRMNFPGRRFIGARVKNNQSHPPYAHVPRNVTFTTDPRSGLGALYQPIFYSTAQGGTALTLHPDVGTLAPVEQKLVTNYQAVFVAPVSAADTINRVKKITFTSSLATTSDADAGSDVGSYRRVLTDFTVPVKTTFNFDPMTGTTGMITENAASEYSYNNSNPSAGRFLQITDPSPLYELKLSAKAKCWNFITNKFELEEIPLPIAGTFTVKMVFISRSELHRRERPDKITE